MERPITIVIADDHALVRGTFAAYLEAARDLKLSGQAADAGAALEMTLRLKPSIVILDIDMPGQLSFDVARQIRKKCPETRVIFLSAFFQDCYIEQALAVEASGYLTKGEPPDAVLKAIRDVAAGGIYFSPEVLSRIVLDSGGARLAAGPRTRAATLTRRELEVLHHIAQGKSKKDIALALHLSQNTVNRHTSSIMTKLSIHDRVELARFAIREGLVEP